MKNRIETSQTLARMAALLAVAAAQAWAEETTARRIVISIPDRKLVLLEGDRVIKVYDTAVGKRSTPTPAGEFEVINRVPHPTWYATGKAVPAGPKNPLGTRWLGLSVKGYGIHGTNVPTSIGKAASHGCIRMRNRDVEELFELVSVGVKVELAGERTELFSKILADD